MDKCLENRRHETHRTPGPRWHQLSRPRGPTWPLGQELEASRASRIKSLLFTDPRASPEKSPSQVSSRANPLSRWTLNLPQPQVPLETAAGVSSHAGAHEAPGRESRKMKRHEAKPVIALSREGTPGVTSHSRL